MPTNIAIPEVKGATDNGNYVVTMQSIDIPYNQSCVVLSNTLDNRWRR